MQLLKTAVFLAVPAEFCPWLAHFLPIYSQTGLMLTDREVALVFAQKKLLYSLEKKLVILDLFSTKLSEVLNIHIFYIYVYVYICFIFFKICSTCYDGNYDHLYFLNGCGAPQYLCNVYLMS